MTPFSLAHSLLNLRGLVEREEPTNQILKSIDSFSIQIKCCGKHLFQVEAEALELRTQTKKMKSKAKKLENQFCKCSKERDSLASELEKVLDIHKSKIMKMSLLVSSRDSEEPSSTKQLSQKKIRKISESVQCQIFTQSSLIEIQEKSNNLQLKVESLQHKYEELYIENKAKELYINQIFLAFDTDNIRNLEDDERIEQKEIDNSTLDNDSQKGSQYSLPEFLEPVQAQQSDEEQFEESPPTPMEKNWLESVRENSLKLCSFIFG